MNLKKPLVSLKLNALMVEYVLLGLTITNSNKLTYLSLLIKHFRKKHTPSETTKTRGFMNVHGTPIVYPAQGLKPVEVFPRQW